MRNESEENDPEAVDMTDPKSLLKHCSKAELSQAVARMRRQLKRMKKQRDDATAKLKGDVLAVLKHQMAKDMGHEHHPYDVPIFRIAGQAESHRCIHCGCQYWDNAPGVCAGKVNAKLDAIVALDQYVA